MPAKVILEVTEGSMKGKRFEFDSHDRFLLGRRSHCQASIDDEYVSRHQFLLEANPPAARLMDLNSTHGTIVNDRKYAGGEQVELHDGDQIRVGKTSLLVRIVDFEAPRHASNIEGEAAVKTSATPEKCTQPEVSKAPEPPAAKCCKQCGKDIGQHGTLKVESTEAPGQDVCSDCEQSAAVGVRRLVQLARNVWKHFVVGGQWEGYEIQSELGRGNMGVVCKARRLSDGHIVAIKSMLSKVAVSENLRKQFFREIDVMRQLRHPHLVSFIESKQFSNQFFFVMEYCDGGSLEGMMERNGGKLSPQVAVPLLIHSLDGLGSAHKAKIVHRDLKPANILLTRTNNRLTAKIGDLGLAKNFEQAGFSGMTMDGTAGGTIAFMPREQVTNFRDVKPTTDIWSLAATFYNAMTGYIPMQFPPCSDEKNWIGKCFEVILNDDPVPIRDRDSSIPQGLGMVFDRALSVDPAQRYQSVAQMKSAVLAACSS